MYSKGLSYNPAQGHQNQRDGRATNKLGIKQRTRAMIYQINLYEILVCTTHSKETDYLKINAC